MSNLNEIKSRVKKLFKVAFNLSKYQVSIKDIKAVFPAFDGRKTTHWFNLIDRLEVKMQEVDQVALVASIPYMTLSDFNAYCHQVVLDACSKYDVQIHNTNWLGYSSQLSAKDAKGIMRVIGSISINRQNVVSITWTRTAFKVVSSVNQGFQILLSIFRKPSAIAA